MKNDILDLGLGKKIQNYRLNKKFTIKELAEKIGITSGLPESNEVRYELLTPDTKGSIEFCLMYIPNNTATEEFNQSHQGEEVAFVLKSEEILKKSEISFNEILEANERLKRFAPYIAKVFPETKISDGIIESPLTKMII